MAQSIIAAMRHPISIAGQNIATRASIGVAYSSENASAERLCASADAALYVAKGAGRNAFHISHLTEGS
jgi:GGDEF domain-containing protein